MPAYEYKCQCGAVYETAKPVDEVKCRATDCPHGTAKRVWAVSINRENIRAVPRG